MEHLDQALLLANNCLKRQQFLESHEKITFRTIINNYNTGKNISKALLKSVFKKSKAVHKRLY